MPITQYTGKTLLQRDTVDRIKKEVNGLLANKDVAAAYSASQHIKRELSGLPVEEVGPLLPEYRRITSSLKALALPVLAEEDVRGLLANNLEFLDTRAEPLLVAGLSAWLASQPDEAQEELKQKLASKIDQDSPFAPKLAAILKDGSAPDAAPTLPLGNIPREYPSGISLGNIPREYSGQARDRPGTGPGQARDRPGGGDVDRTVREDGMLAPSERDDVARSAKKASAVSARPPADAGIDSIARGLFSLSGSRGSEEAFVKRAAALANSRLRDIRTAAEFADYAQRPFAAGGLGLSGDALEQAEHMMEEAYSRSHGLKAPKEPELAAVRHPSRLRLRAGSGGREAADRISANNRQDSIASPADSAGSLQNDKKEVPPAPKPPLPVQAPQAQRPKPPLPAPAPKPAQGASRSSLASAPLFLAPRPQSTSTKPRLDDVKPAFVREPQPDAPRAMGLADELGTIAFVDFRGFGDAKAAQEAILGKIATLAGESISAKLAGMRSLRASPLFGRYLALVDRSLSGSQKLAEVLADPSANPERMTEDEFFAIADLAGKLK